MEAIKQNNPQKSLIEINQIVSRNDDFEGQNTVQEIEEVKVYDYSKRAQWLRAAVLGANDGLLSTASLMVGVGAVRQDVKTMVLAGLAGLVAGASSMAIGEFVSVYSQYDIEVAQMKRENTRVEKSELPNPLQAAAASATAFTVGGLVPLVAAAFIKNYRVRVGVVVAAVSLALVAFGGLGAFLGRSPLVKSSLRILIGGWFAMGITFGLTKLIGSIGLN
ncbi:Vacuolar iron transporter4 [Abeliophyllum distichum]|uniref:Vacuolar iron transporter n=1 Tax=Abeliophyllum distichum TaxID=126358 RepID=A0ABD1RRH1_9LAMI